jgi:hypothetical protein
MKKAVLFALIAFLSLSNEAVSQEPSPWENIDDGLSVGEFDAPKKSTIGDSRILVIRVDPRKYQFKLLCRSELGHDELTISEWCRRYGLIGAVNAGMFQTDYRSNVGYMKNFKHINNATVSSSYQSVAVFEPLKEGGQAFRIVDTDVTPLKTVVDAYGIVIQNLRLIKRPALNRWQENNRRWSEAALGEDKQGNVLMIFSRSPYSMHELNRMLLELPIDLVAAQHLEGGPEASLFFAHKEKKILRVGSFETGFNEQDDNSVEWPIPNVLGFVRRSGK